MVGFLAISGGSARAQGAAVSWNSAVRESSGRPVVRTSRELLPEERLEIEVVKGVDGLHIGIAQPNKPVLKEFQPNDTKQGSTISFPIPYPFQVSMGVWKDDRPARPAIITNAKDSTLLSYGEGSVILRVKVLPQGTQPVQPATGSKPNPDDDKPADPRWEVITEKDGKLSIVTKQDVKTPGTITVQPVKVVSGRWVSIGLRNKDNNYLDNPQPNERQ